MTTQRATRKTTQPKPQPAKAGPVRITYTDAAGVAREASVASVVSEYVELWLSELAAAGARSVIVHPSE